MLKNIIPAILKEAKLNKNIWKWIYVMTVHKNFNIFADAFFHKTTIILKKTNPSQEVF